MTRKDYILIAEVLRNLADDFSNGGSDEVSLSLVASELARALATDNPRFDREKFISRATATQAKKDAITAQL